MRKQLLTIFLTICCLSATAKDAGDDYNSLARLSSQQLMDSGRDYFGQREAGKALARFLIVSERYKQSNDEEDILLSIRALNNCACVYKYFYFDYAQAYEYFTQAYDLCKQAHYDDFLPVIMVNLGDLLNDYGISYNSQALSQQAQDIFEQCMQQAVDTKNWELMTTAFFNLANQNYTLKLEKYKGIFDKAIPDNTVTTPAISTQYSRLIATFEKTTPATAIQATPATPSAARILGSAEGIHVTNAQPGDQLSVYTIDGRLVRSQRLAGTSTDITLKPDALYVIRVADKVVKVRL